MAASKNKRTVVVTPLEDDPLWYQDGIICEIHVRAYHDSNGDGIGDFAGLTQKLDYLQDLGVTALWLLPFYPSPLRDDGYDIADYTTIHPSYGTLADFKKFLSEAHRRGLRVITELVLNHTSDQHPWFQRARRSKPGSVGRDYYVWSDTPDKYRDARIIFKDTETSNWAWDPVAGAYYWHRFFSHQPDLNFENPAVRKAMLQVVDFWFGLGVDGLRLDAVPYLFETEGTNCENLPPTHAYLKELRQHVEKHFKNRMLLAEANQWPEDAVAYFGAGDECHMCFHFPIMPRLFMAIRMENRFPIIDILDQTPALPANCVWALFLRNHDELTLEMVTDEERDYMYRSYAIDPQMRINLGIRRRLAPLLSGDRRRFELMKGLLFSLPGTPVIYYGDEIGMGDNIYLGDRNAVRTPMQWSPDRNAGFSRANSQKLYMPVVVDPEYHYEAVNVMAQQSNQFSLLWWMKRLIELRKRTRAMGRGTIEFLFPENSRVLAFLRHYEKTHILVVANLSRLAQYVELDLSKFQGMVPTEMLSAVDFPPIGELPYLLTLGPHAFFWFTLEPHVAHLEQLAADGGDRLPTLRPRGKWESLLKGEGKADLENLLPDYLRASRWFGGKARRLKAARIVDVIDIPADTGTIYLTMVRVEYADGEPELYQLAIAATGDERVIESLLRERPKALIARLEGKEPGRRVVLFDAMSEKIFGATLLQAMTRRRVWRNDHGELTATPSPALRRHFSREELMLEPAAVRGEQSNTSVTYGDRLILKLFRRLEDGVNPDLEVGKFLTERTEFKQIAPVYGSLDFRTRDGREMTLGLLHGFIANEGDAWHYTVHALGDYFERALTHPVEEAALPPRREHGLELLDKPTPELATDLIGPYLESAYQLGQRTAEMHLALASNRDDSHFFPEPFSLLYQRSLYQSMRNRTGAMVQLLRQKVKDLPDGVRERARRVLEARFEIVKQFRAIVDHKITGMRIRIHGDYHLGQVLFTGRDFVIIDFEGEPTRSIGERCFKRSPLRDVAGMMRSFHYALSSSMRSEAERGVRGWRDKPELNRWAEYWYVWVAAAYLKAYLERAGAAPFLPQTKDEVRLLLDTFLLEKAVYEMSYELNNRPDWLHIPIGGILSLIGDGE